MLTLIFFCRYTWANQSQLLDFPIPLFTPIMKALLRGGLGVLAEPILVYPSTQVHPFIA
jgi:hypothetical protein